MTGEGCATSRVYKELLTRTGEANPRPRIEAVRRLAELAGSPQLSYPVIHVAGTNGKTSTSRAIESLLRAHGLRTGLFTSPHLVNFSERFQIDGEPVDEDVLCRVWGELHEPLRLADHELDASGQGPITFFEAVTVLAFSLFSDAPVEVAVIEVGMGGEWDATNIADSLVSVFTPIALDHTEILGAHLSDIARTKAGIIKTSNTVVSAKQHPDALAEIVAACARTGSCLYAHGQDFHLNDDRLAVGGRHINVTGISGATYNNLFVPLFGQHQAENVTLAIAAVETFFGARRELAEDVISEGVNQLTSPGRLQMIGADPAVCVDAAHNPHGAQALVKAVTESFAFSHVLLIIGVLAEKDCSALFAELAPIAHRVILNTVDSPRALSAEAMLPIAQREMPDVWIGAAKSMAAALEDARCWAKQGEGRAVLVTGSVLLAGEAVAVSREQGWSIA